MSEAPRRCAPESEEELILRAQMLAGRRVGQLAKALEVPLPDSPTRAKGFVGQLVELALGADPDAGERPDFVALGVELKTLPLNQKGVPAESTFCCTIDRHAAERACWEDSRLRQRLAKVLFVPVDAASTATLCERSFHDPLIWKPNNDDLRRLREDWVHLMGRLGAGLSLSAHLGDVLQVRPKGRNASVRTATAVGNGQPVAFYLRARFTSELLSRMRPDSMTLPASQGSLPRRVE